MVNPARPPEVGGFLLRLRPQEEFESIAPPSSPGIMCDTK